MTLDGLLAGVAQRRSSLIAAFSVPLAAILILYIGSQRDWQEQAQSLRRENLSLQVRELASSLEKERADLGAAAGSLADNEGMAEWLQDEAAAARVDAAHLDAKTAARLDIDGITLATGTGSIRFSAVIDGGQLTERPPDPAQLRYLAALAARAPGETASSSSAMLDDRLIAARPIATRPAPAPPGWVLVTRRLTPALLARLQRPLGGRLSGQPVRQFDQASAPSDVREWLDSKPPAPTDISTEVSEDRAAYALLRDADGKPAWVFRLIPAGAADAGQSPASFKLRSGRGVTTMLAAFAALLAAAVAATVILAVKGYLGHRRSVDSRYKAIIDQTNDGIVIVDAESLKVQYCNPAFLGRIGHSETEARDLTLTEIFADAGSTPETLLARLRDADSKRSLDLQLRCKDGALVDVEVRCNPLEADGREGFAYVTHDVSVAARPSSSSSKAAALDHLAHHDQLTGLPNRHYLAAYLPEAIEEARAATPCSPCCSSISTASSTSTTTRGHETGDKLLQEVARARCAPCVRETDVVMRMGGDEFVVVFRSRQDPTDEVTLGASRIIEAPEQADGGRRHPLVTTVSIGVSCFRATARTWASCSALGHRDVPGEGSRPQQLPDVQPDHGAQAASSASRWRRRCATRCGSSQLDVHYQPIVDLITRKRGRRSRRCMRWKHPVHGMIPPGALHRGRRGDRPHSADRQFRAAAGPWRTWRAGSKAGGTVPVSLNVAAVQLQRSELPRRSRRC